jgi:hypothetical protein
MLSRGQYSLGKSTGGHDDGRLPGSPGDTSPAAVKDFGECSWQMIMRQSGPEYIPLKCAAMYYTVLATVLY